MATSIEDRVRQLGDRLGEPLGPPEQLTARVRLAPYYNALIIEVDGEAWVLAEATVAARFPDAYRPAGAQPGSPQVRNTMGRDLGPLFLEAAAAAGISVQLLIACAIAESGLNPYAERWGRETPAARAAIAANDWDTLQGILELAWPDVSFGYSQRIVLFHELGDRTPTLRNVLAVRDQVFANPDAELRRMAGLLASHQANAAGQDLSPVGGDVELAALVSYNAGRFPPARLNLLDLVRRQRRVLPRRLRPRPRARPVTATDWSFLYGVIVGIPLGALIQTLLVTFLGGRR